LTAALLVEVKDRLFARRDLCLVIRNRTAINRAHGRVGAGHLGRNPHQYCSREQIEKAKASADSDRFIDHFKSIRRLGNCAKMEI